MAAMATTKVSKPTLYDVPVSNHGARVRGCLSAAAACFSFRSLARAPPPPPRSTLPCLLS